MLRSRRGPVIFVAFLAAVGCKGQPAPSAKAANSDTRLEPLIQEDMPSAVQFDLKPVSVPPSSPGAELFDCAFTSRGQTAKFRLEIKQGAASADQFPMAPAEGRFIAVPGSINKVLLEELKKALDAKHAPINSRRVSELAFTAVVLGQKQSRSLEGGYSDKPLGDWVLVKPKPPKEPPGCK